MISIKVFRNDNGEIFGFEAENHSKGIVCASVSVLLLNAVNSIECFTDEELSCDADENGGYLKLILPRIKENGADHDANLILNSVMLGLNGIAEEYPGEIRIFDKPFHS